MEWSAPFKLERFDMSGAGCPEFVWCSVRTALDFDSPAL